MKKEGTYDDVVVAKVRRVGKGGSSASIHRGAYRAPCPRMTDRTPRRGTRRHGAR